MSGLASNRPARRPRQAVSRLPDVCSSIVPGLPVRRFIGRIRNRDQRHLYAWLLRCGFFAREGATRGAFAFHLAKVRRPGRVAETGGFIFVGEFQQCSRANRATHPSSACGSPIFAKRSGTVKSVKSAGSQSGTSSQCKRSRNAGIWQRAHRICRAGGAVLRVLVVVEEDAMALLLPPFRTGQSGRAPLDRAR